MRNEFWCKVWIIQCSMSSATAVTCSRVLILKILRRCLSDAGKKSLLKIQDDLNYYNILVS